MKLWNRIRLAHELLKEYEAQPPMDFPTALGIVRAYADCEKAGKRWEERLARAASRRKWAEEILAKGKQYPP